MSNYPPPPPPPGGDPNQPNPYGQQPPPPPGQYEPPTPPPNVPPPPGYGQQQPPPPAYGQPQPPAYGQPPAYPQQGGYGQQPAYGGGYGQPGYGAPGMSPFGEYAGVGTRLAALLIDALVAVGAGIVFIIVGAVIAGSSDGGAGAAIGILVLIFGYVVVIGVQIWNLVLKQGTTGQSIGKGVMNIKVIGLGTGQPLGNGGAFVRWLMHTFIDGNICALGFLWALWDDKKQTWADKVANSIVVKS